jgi:hypothetical protein
MKICIIFFFFTFSVMAAPRKRPETQKKRQQIYQDYIAENTKIKLEQENKLFNHQLQFLKRNHELRKIYIKKLNNLKSQMSLINKKNNKALTKKITQLKREFKNQSTKRRKEFQKDILGPEMKKYENALKKEKKTINAKLKKLRIGSRG